MLDYIIQVLLFQILFLAVYDIVLKKETFFQWNRAYLVITSVLAYAIPLIKIEQVAEVVPQEYMVYLPEVVLSPQTAIKEQFDWSTLIFSSLKWIFWLGIAIAFILFLLKLIKVIQLIRLNEKEKEKKYELVFLEQSSPFSFFRYIFLQKQLAETVKQQIIEHELVHVQQKHSIELLFFELQKIVFWFNPFSYLFQKRISELHEFIADSESIKQTDKSHYFQNLLAETFSIHKISFINPFFKHSLIKKRIVMLNKNKSKQLVKFKYLLLVPLLAGMLIYSSCERLEAEQLNKNEKRLITLYMGVEGKIDRQEIKTKKEGYFDLYMGDAPEGEKITYDKLSIEEKTEYDKTTNAFNKNGFKTFEIFEMNDGKRALFQIVDWKGMKERGESKDYSNAEDVPFAVIEKAPVFPGCDDLETQKYCLQNSITLHVNSNFNVGLANNLGLDSGRKKIYVQFKINKEGNITDVRARGPHKALEDEALRVINSLPKMMPGKYNGKEVGVKYTLPITLNIQ